jgi:hypothetical protein
MDSSMPWYNITAFNVAHAAAGEGGQSAPSDSEGADWAVIGGGGGGAFLVLLLVVLLVVKRDAEAVRAVLEQFTLLCTAISNIISNIRARQQPPAIVPAASASPGPHGSNFTDSFLVQWRAARRERANERARSVNV